MYTYRDMTFCINKKCKQKCDRRFTDKIGQDAHKYGLPVAVADFNENLGCEFYSEEEIETVS